MINTLKITIFLALFVGVFACSKDDNPADDFLGTQDVTLMLNGESFAMKGGDYYNSLGESNCEIADIRLDASSFEFKFNNGVGFERFSFKFSNTFGIEGLPIGVVNQNPGFFFFSFKQANEGESFVGAQLNGEDTYVNGDIGDSQRVEITNSSLIINERVSNGNEQVIDGVRQDYPLERIGGTLNVSFNNELGESQNLEVDFALEGDNIVIEPDENIFSDPVDDGGNGGGNGGGGADCNNLVYSGPTSGQDMQWCQAAQLYQCLGATTELNYVCDALAQSNVNCSYCN